MTNQILALPAECWRWIPGFEGIYQVSTRGRVRSVDRWETAKDGKKQFYEGRILKPQRYRNGYLYVTLCRNNKPRHFLLHRLVAETWLDNPDNKPEVNHLDENKENCSVENLSYCDHKTNANWGTAIKRRTTSRSKPVQAINPKTGQVVKEFPSTAEAGRNGFTQATVSACCNGKVLSHRGLVWRYKDDYDQENAWTPVKIGMESRVAILSKPVQAINPSTGDVVLEFPSASEAGRKGFDQSAVSQCCRGERKTHKGYMWRYKP